jgi:uncharacterized protein YjbJ (UPF0337 family)
VVSARSGRVFLQRNPPDNNGATDMDNEGIKNTAEELKGKAKETLGDLTDNERLESEGAAEEAHAKAKQDVEDAAEDLRDASETEARIGALDDDR